MKLTYDPETNAAFLHLQENRSPGDVEWSHVCDVDIKETAIILEFDKTNRLLGVEILGARKILPEEVFVEMSFDQSEIG